MALVAIRGRRGTASQWSTANPILGLGEFGLETSATTPKLKFGDGVTRWNSLPYVAGTGGGGGTVASTDITDSTVTGRAVIVAASQAAARTAIGAGTSNVVLGTTAGTALAGNTAFVPPTRNVGGHPLSSDVTLVAADIGGLSAAILAQFVSLGVFVSVKESGGVYPNRPATTGSVIFVGADTPAAGGTTAGGTPAAVNGLDFWWKTA